MGKSSDNEESNGNDVSEEEDVEEMHLNPNLVYKVGDLNSKEKPCPYFKSNQPKTVAAIGQDKGSKSLIMDIMHSLNKLTDTIKVSCYSTLIAFGMGVAAVDTTEAPSKESSLFVLYAVQDCAIRATAILRQEGIAPSNPYLSFRSNVIAAGLAEYWQKGAKCCSYHELFFNGLLVVLHGGLGNRAEGILHSVKDYYAYHFERAYIVDDRNRKEFDLMALEPGIFNEISYATFPNKRKGPT